MWLRLHRELRELALSWFLSVGLVVTVCLLTGTARGWPWFLLVAGMCLYLSVRPFGIEMERGTLARLLSQPLSRQRIWWEKHLAAAVAVLLGIGALALAFVSQGASFANTPRWWILAFAALAMGPGLSLLLRDSLQSFWVGLILATMIHFAAIVLGRLISSGGHAHANAQWALLPFGLLLTAWGYRRFQRFELGVLGSWLGDGTTNRCQAEAKEKPRSGYLGLLLGKELRLQRSNLILSLLAATIGALAVVLSPLGDRSVGTGATVAEVLAGVGFFAIYTLAIVVPLLVGADAVAAERRLRVLSPQLSLPASHRVQWWTKVGVCIALTLAAGALPAIVLASVLPSTILSLVTGIRHSPAGLICGALVAMGCGLFGSRYTRRSFTAVGIGLVFCIAVAFVGQLLGYTALIILATNLAIDAALFRLLPTISVVVLALAVAAMLYLLTLASPSQEEWISGRARRWRRPTSLVLVAVLGAYAAQIVCLQLVSARFDRQLESRDQDLLRIGQVQPKELLGLHLDVEAYRQGLQPIIVYGRMASFHDPTSRAIPRAMDHQVLAYMATYAFDHLPELWGSLWRWTYGQQFSAQDQAPAQVTAVNVGNWSILPVSIAPVWYPERRSQQIDYFFRQESAAEALEMLLVLESSPWADRNKVKSLLQDSPLAGLPLQLRALE